MKRFGLAGKLVLWVVALQLLCPLHLLAEGIGKITEARGDVSLTRASKVSKPQPNDPVFVRDTVSAAERSRAKLLLVNDTQLSVGPGSVLEITEFMAKDGRQTGALSLTKGAVHTKILKALTPESRFEVRTPNAVAGARGTEWLSVITEGQDEAARASNFYTLEERISVVNPEFPNQGVVVNKGEYTEVKKGFPPTVPVAFSIAAIIGILTQLGIAPGAAGAGGAAGAAGAAGGSSGASTAAGISAGTAAAIAAGAAVLIGGVIAATGTGGGGGGGGIAPSHSNPSPSPIPTR